MRRKHQNRSIPQAETTFTGFAIARKLANAACAELAPGVADTFFDIHFQKDVLRRKAAQNICARCVVAPECLQEALHGPSIDGGGVIAGISLTEVRRARSWLRYETGVTEHPPAASRPSWLPRSEAAETVEQYRIDSDPDE